MRTGRLVEYEAGIRCPACRYLPLPVPPGCLTGETGGDPPAGKGRGVAPVRVVNPGHYAAVAGQVLGQRGERAAGVGEAGREHDDREAVLTAGRPGVATALVSTVLSVFCGTPVMPLLVSWSSDSAGVMYRTRGPSDGTAGYHREAISSRALPPGPTRFHR